MLRITLLLGVLSLVLSANIKDTGRVEDAAFWNKLAQGQLKSILERKLNTNVAKNVILFLGDGMGLTTVTAGRILKGQLKGKTGEEENLEFDTFPNAALVKTYNTDRQTPDSAGTATAYLCGVKANAGTVGLDNGVSRLDSDCVNHGKSKVDSILKMSQAEGKSVGVVTNTRITHATPSASYAHCSEREWESDALLPENHNGCKDIADQLITENPDIQVILGGGRRAFVPVSTGDPITNEIDTSNNRKDGRDLIQLWKSDKETRGVNHKVLYNNQDIKNTDTNTVQYLLGLFSSSHMSYELERDNSTNGQPSLAEMTELAINVLQKNEKGYFLLVEGGRIDHAHHDSKAKKSLYEVLAFDIAVKKALEMTNEENTLIVVTADHSHVFVIGGYPSRGNDILGLTDSFGNVPSEAPNDLKPSTTLLYGNGPGHNGTHPRQNLTGYDIHDNDYIQQSAVPMIYETHGAEDVAVYARGPMSHLFQGVQEQNYIAHVMAYVSCVGVNKDHCKQQSSNQEVTVMSTTLLLMVTFLSTVIIY